MSAPIKGADEREPVRCNAADGKTEVFNIPGYPLMVRAVDFNGSFYAAQGSAKDAARYLWLRDQHWVEPEAVCRLNLVDGEYLNQYHAQLDAAIDSFIAALSQQGDAS